MSTPNFEIELNLPTVGSAIVQFDATFDHGSREWEVGGIWVAFDAPDDWSGVVDFDDLPPEDKEVVTAGVNAKLEEDKPSSDESAAVMAEERGYHEGKLSREQPDYWD